MKLGILDCVPPEYYEAAFTVREHIPFVDLLHSVGFHGTVQPYHVANNEFPDYVEACDSYLLTGSPATAYHADPWIERLKQFIVDIHDAQIPLVGICFGHQIIAEALGGKVEKREAGWQTGLYEFNVVEQTACMQPLQSKVKLYHFNQDQVTVLPPNAVHLGASTACENTMYVIGNHVLSIQGHPEMSLEAYQGFVKFLESDFTDDEIRYARESVAAEKPDAMIIGEWIRNFIELGNQ